MENSDALSGFTEVFDAFAPIGGFNNEDDLSDEQLEALKKNSRTHTPSVKDLFADKFADKENNEEELEDPVDEEEEEEEEIEETPKKKRGRPRKEDTEEEEEVESPKEEDDEPTDEGLQVGLFFDAVAEELGLDFEEDEEKPSTVEELVTYFKDIINENSVPTYANDQMAQLDEFVRQGGRLEDYLSITAELDLDLIDKNSISDKKKVIKELLLEKGFSSAQISKKIQKYEAADILDDEFEDAIEALEDIREAKKERLLENQKKQHEIQVENQQKLVESVVDGIKSLNDIRGIKIPEKDRKELLRYIFKTDANGKSQYQKDYAKNVNNLIESAYFTMRRDALLDNAKKTGSNSAIKNLKKSLNSGSGTTKGTKQFGSNSSESIWDSVATQFRKK